ncbi:UNVERIFIED_CONTAM: hypothetical protein PYX00_005968 [Menopon gallinae]|uniref:Uncharacterized protein n=1 Tax=Menopon gallinae TaxID=328185 RepID=A0AAW2HTL8_9NEOP
MWIGITRRVNGPDLRAGELSFRNLVANPGLILNGLVCDRFVLGTRVHANRYIQQFTEIFTEEGRKSVRITHVIPGQQHRVSYTPGMRERNAAHNLAKQDRSKLGQTGTVATTQGKQPTSVANSPQSSILPQNINMQPLLPNSQHISLPTNIEISSSGTINFNLNSQQIQKLHGQLNTTSTNALAPNSNPNSTIQINSVSHLTSLLTNSNVTAPPNVNVHQIQQGQSVIGIASQPVTGLGQQGRQNLVNVQNIGISGQNLSNSTIQNLLTNALSSNSLTEESITSLHNGPISNVSQSPVNNSSNSTVHHPPSQPQVPASKPSRSPISTNPAISALVTSLMNSAQQFQVQQAAQQAANNSSTVQSNSASFTPTYSSSTCQNPTILSLLNASTPLNISTTSSSSNPTNSSSATNSNSNAISTANLSQQNQKLISRKTITNLLNSRLLNQNLSAVNNNVNSPTLVVNNSNPQPLRVTLSSLNQLMGATNQNSGNANQILNIGNVSNSSSSTGFTVSTTPGSISLPTQASNSTTQSFTLTNTSQTFTITTQNAQNQTYSLSAPAMGNLTKTQNFSGNLSSQSFTLSPASSNTLSSTGYKSISPANSNKDFGNQPAQNSGSQTFTVLQPNQGSQSFTITAPVVSVGAQGFTVTNAQAAIGNQAFTITSGSVSPVSTKTFQINNPGTTNHTFTISTPIVTVANHFANSSSPSQNFGSSQKFVLNTPSSQSNTSNVFTVSSVPNQVFTVNIPSSASSHNANFSPSFTSSNQTSQSKNISNQSSVLINKNQAFTINASNQSFASLISNNQSFNNLKNADSMLGGGGGANASENGSGKVIGNNSGPAAINRNSAGRIAACQRKLSNALQQVTQNSELNKLLSERSDTILLAEANALFNDKSEGVLNDGKVIEKKPESSKLSQALSGNMDSGTNSPGNTAHGLSSTSNLGLSMPGLSALLAGTPSADNPIPGASNSSSLLERLASSAPNAAFTSPPLPSTPQSPNISSLSPNQNFQNSTYATSSTSNTFNSVNSNSPLSTMSPSVPNFTSSSPKNQVQFQSPSPNSKEILGISSPLSSPPGSGPVSLNLQGLSLQGIPGLQNVQVSIPGLAVPISLSLNVAGQPGNTQGVIMTSLPVAPTTNTNTTTTSASTMVLTNAGSSSSTGSILSLPVAPLMTQGTKSGNQRSTSISAAQGNPQSIQLVSSLQRPCRSTTNQIQGSKNIQTIASRGLINAQKGSIKTAGNSQISGSLTTTGLGNQVLTLTAQQQLQLALQKQAQIQQCYNQQNQKRPISPSSVANKHRRRSNTTDSNK